MQTETKRAVGAKQTSETNIFKTKTVVREKGNHVTIKTPICQEDLTIINMYKPNHRAPIYMKHKLTELKGRNRRFNISS